ncbi:MAG: glucose-6-phosphate isomerase family protein [bacterium]
MVYQVRKLKDISDVLYDQEWAKTADPNLVLYEMQRETEIKNNMRYDITIIPAKMLGKEFIKTKGHSHPEQEEYQVLEGKAIFLLGAKAIRAKAGDKVVIPANCPHVTINPSKTQALKLANWISKDSQGDYSEFVKKQGACYFYTIDGWIKNKNYAEVAELEYA